MIALKSGSDFCLVRKNDEEMDESANEYAIFKNTFSDCDVYHKDERLFQPNAFWSTTGIFSDQVFINHVLSNRNGLIFHSSGIIYSGHGLLFVGRSGTGKTTIVRLFPKVSKLLSEDRVIVRNTGPQHQIFGTWFHDFSVDTVPGPAPLRAIFMLNQSGENKIKKIDKTSHAVELLAPCLVKPIETKEWWKKSLDTMEKLAGSVPIYQLFFDKSGDIVGIIEDQILSMV
jgi:hypothetical protein